MAKTTKKRPAAKNPPTKTVKISDDAAKKLKIIAAMRDETASDVVEAALAEYIEAHKDEFDWSA